MTTVIPKFVELGFRYRWAPAAISGAISAGYQYLTMNKDDAMDVGAQVYSGSLLNNSSSVTSSSSSSSSSTSYASSGSPSASMPTRYGKSKKSYKPYRASRSGKSRSSATSRFLALTERKYHDLPAFTMVPGTDRSVDSVHHINGLYVGSLGNLVSQRSSASPYVKTLNLIGELESSVSSTPGRLDLFVVRDLAPLTALPTVSDIFSSPFTMPNANCMPNTDNISRFKILRRYTFNFNDSLVAGANQPFNITIPMNFTMRFKPGVSTSGIGDITENAVYLCALSTNAYGETPSLRISGRFFYFDR